MPKRSDLKILGRTIGTFDGWDGDMDWTVYYQFEPVDVLKDDLPEGALTVDILNGVFTYADDNGNVTQSVDIVHIANMMQKDA